MKHILRRLPLALVPLLQSQALIASELISRDHDAYADYGVMGVLHDYAEPRLKTGHTAMQPVMEFMEPYFDFKTRLAESGGINYVIEYAPLYQRDLEGNHGHTVGDETNLIMQWAPASREGGSLMAWYQHQSTWSDKNTSDFMQQMGVLSPLNGGVSGPGNKSNDYLQHFAWEQWLDDHTRFMAGKLTTRVLLNLNRYAVSDREDFFSPMLVNNPVAPYTARIGLGAFGQYREDDWYLSGMVRQADGTSQWFDVGSLSTDELEYVAELGFTPPNLAGLGQGNYRITPSYTDKTDQQPSGWTLSFSFDQDVGERVGALLRYAYAYEDFRTFKQRLSLGAQIKHPLNFQNDRIGVGAWWGEPTDSTLDDERGIDMYWMAQLAPFLEVTADLQVIFDPALDNSNRDWIGGLRARFVF